MESCFPLGVRKGAWTKDEDVILRNYILNFGEGKWHQVPSRTGLNRCRKSCRLRWLNYLRPNIKRGEFASDEVDLIMRLHKLLGNRWSLIAGRITGRTANDIKNYWNTNIRKKIVTHHHDKIQCKPKHANQTEIIKPLPWTFFKNSLIPLKEKCTTPNQLDILQPQENQNKPTSPPLNLGHQEKHQNHHNELQNWWENLLVENDGFGKIDPRGSSINWLEEEPIIGKIWGHDDVEITKKVGTKCALKGQNGNSNGLCSNSEPSFSMDIWNLLGLENENIV